MFFQELRIKYFPNIKFVARTPVIPGVNDDAKYTQFKSIDMYIDMEYIRLVKEGKINPNEQQS